MGESQGSRLAAAGAVSFGLLTLTAGLAGVPLTQLAHQPNPGGPLLGWLTTALALVPGTAVGTLLAARRPANPIGWLLLAVFFLGSAPAGDYAIIDYRMHHGTLPLGSVVVVMLASWPVWLLCIAILLWVFPDGRLPGGRWRRTAGAAVVIGVVLAVAATAAGAAAVAGHQVRVDPTGNLATKTTGLAGVIQLCAVTSALLSVLAWLLLQVPRYRRAPGERREQLKWLYSGAAVFAACLFAAVLSTDNSSATSLAINDMISPLGFAVLPVCIGVAVLKYHLYAIDRIVSRVIAYAIVTAVLAGVFAGLVLLATEVLPFRGAVGVAASTLAAAALFSPLRRRVQRGVDRRFNRARYDAGAITAAFAGRLRHTVDLDTVRADLIDTAVQACQPAHISVWLPRPGS